MIIDLPTTTTETINRTMIELRDSGGAVALGRVMTLVIVTDDADAEHAIEAANDASREHPCRVLVLVRGARSGAPRLDAQIRVGGDAGASEVIVLRMYGDLADHGESVAVPMLLPDAPIVTWWPGRAPTSAFADPVGAIAQRRITDSAASADPIAALDQLRASHHAGDTDLAWSRVTAWRALLAAALDQPPFDPVTSVRVAGAADSPSTDLLAGWLALMLRCTVVRSQISEGTGMHSVRLERASGAIDLVRPDGDVATLTQPGQPERRISLPRRADRECLAEELRRLDPDDVFGEVLGEGLSLITRSGTVEVQRPSVSERAAGAVRRAAEMATRATTSQRERAAAAAEGPA